MSVAAAHIQSIAFDPEGVEIVYAEEDDILENGLRLFRTAVIPRGLVAAQLADLEEAAQSIVDQVAVIRRSPESTFQR